MIQFSLDEEVFEYRSLKDAKEELPFLDSAELWSKSFGESLKIQQLSDRPFNIIDLALNKASEDALNLSEICPVVNASLNTHSDIQFSEDEASFRSFTERDETERIPCTFSWEQLNRNCGSTRQEVLVQHGINTPFLTEAPKQCYEPLYQYYIGYQTNSATVQDRQLLNDLIQVLAGSPSICFRWNGTIKAFEPRVENIRILGVSSAALKPVIFELLAFGTRMKKLELAAKECKANPSRYGLTGTAFACCLSELLLNIQNAIMIIFRDVKEVTILKIHQYMASLISVIGKLAKIIRLEDTPEPCSPKEIQDIHNYGFYIPFGGELLTLLYNEVQSFDFSRSGCSAFYKDICLAILKHSSMPYLAMINQWLGLCDAGNGDWIRWTEYSPIQDPHSEFFIHDTKTTKNRPQLDEDPNKRFQYRENVVRPCFISDDMAALVLRAGISLQFLRQSLTEHPLCKMARTHSVTDVFKTPHLEWLLTGTQISACMDQLRGACEYVCHYDSETDRQAFDTLTYDKDKLLQIRNDTDDNDMDMDLETDSTDICIPSLKELEEVQLIGEFSLTLREIMDCHSWLEQGPYEDEAAHFIPTVETIAIQSLHQPLQVWCPLLNSSAMTLFFDQFKVRDHLSMLHRFFLFGEGTFISGIAEALFVSDTSENSMQRAGLRFGMYGQERWPPEASVLNMSLRAVLLASVAQISSDDIRTVLDSIRDETLAFDDLVTFTVRRSEKGARWLNPEAVEALDFLSLTYKTYYPLHVVISPTTLDKYNCVFSFVLKLLRISAITKQHYHLLHPRCSIVAWHIPNTRHFLSTCRFQMEQFITALSSYVFDTAIHNTWTMFMNQVDSMRRRPVNLSSLNGTNFQMDPLTFKDYHEYVINQVLKRCFLQPDQRHAMQVMLQLMKDVIAFAVLLDDYRTKQRSIDEERQLRRHCERVFKGFRKNMSLFTQVLNSMIDEQTGSNSTETFRIPWPSEPQPSDLNTFVKQLLVRLGSSESQHRY